MPISFGRNVLGESFGRNVFFLNHILNLGLGWPGLGGPGWAGDWAAWPGLANVRMCRVECGAGLGCWACTGLGWGLGWAGLGWAGVGAGWAGVAEAGCGWVLGVLGSFFF